jgi:hypothetical protein
MNRKSVLVVAAVAIASGALARIGETKAELEARYKAPAKVVPGPAFVDGQSCAMYTNAGFMVFVQFQRGRSAHEMYQKTGPKPGEFPAISPTELAGILKANSAGAKWEEQPNGLIRSDAGALAFVGRMRDSLTIMTSEYAYSMKAEKDAAEKKVADQF